MGNFFLAYARHAKALEFLELRQGAMIVLEYVAKLTKLAHFGDDYMNTNMAKVRKFEDGLKLSIQGKIVGLLQNMDSMVKTALAIKREVNDAKSMRDAGASEKRKENQPSSSSSRISRGLLLREGFRDKAAAPKAKARISHPKMGGTSRLLAS